MKKVVFLLLTACVAFNCLGQSNATLTINYQETNRNFIVHLPPAYSAGTHLPVVFNLHGYTSNAAQQQLYSGMDATANANNFIVVYPNGLNNSWNSGFIPPYNGTFPDDVGFISKIIDTLYTLYGIDLQRVYCCGMSNGGYQSYRMACDLENRIAAIASVTGSMTGTMTANCTLSRSVPVLEIHGTNDPTVPYNGANGSMPIEDVVAFWAGKDQCSATHDTTNVANTNTTDNSTVQEIRYRTCNSGSEVWFYKVIGGEHTWPGSSIIIGATNQDINASQEIWDFFNRYTLNGGVNGLTEPGGQRAQIKLYPNPAGNLVKLESSELLQSVEIADVPGKSVLSKKVNAANLELNIEALPKGVYFIKVKGNGFEETERLIKE